MNLLLDLISLKDRKPPYGRWVPVIDEPYWGSNKTHNKPLIAKRIRKRVNRAWKDYWIFITDKKLLLITHWIDTA